jgi:hypothetical protein
LQGLKSKEVKLSKSKEVASVVEGEKVKEDEFEENVDFFETIVTNLETYKSKSLVDC